MKVIAKKRYCAIASSEGNFPNKNLYKILYTKYTHTTHQVYYYSKAKIVDFLNESHHLVTNDCGFYTCYMTLTYTHRIRNRRQRMISWWEMRKRYLFLPIQIDLNEFIIHFHTAYKALNQRCFFFSYFWWKLFALYRQRKTITILIQWANAKFQFSCVVYENWTIFEQFCQFNRSNEYTYDT